MSLPKIAHPTFDLIQPSTGEKLLYRPFLVKEEKILLIAKESGDKHDIHNAIKQIVNNCVIKENFDVNKIPIFDMEYIFINIRAKSVSNIIEFKVEDSTDELEYSFELNLDEVEVQFDESHNKKIQVNDTIGIMMKYPNAEIGDKILNMKSMTDITFETIMQSIDYVYDEESVYPWHETSLKEKEEFLDTLDRKAFENIINFFGTMPKIEHVIEYENSKQEKKRIVFRNLEDFFTLD
jgi:hypothetical protein